MLVVDPDAAAGAGSLFLADPAAATVRTIATGAPFADPVSVLSEPPTCNGALATAVGTPGADRIVGSRFIDILSAGAGNDVIRAANNTDIVCGVDGIDRINGNKGADILEGGAGKDRINGAPGPDTINGGPGRDRCDGKGSKDKAVGCERRLHIP